MTTPSITFSKKVIEELLEIQDDIEDASKLSNKVIKQNVNDIDTIVHKIENRLVPKGGSNQPIFRERVSKATLRRFLYIFVVIAGIYISHIVYKNDDDLRFAIKTNIVIILKKVEDFVLGINLFSKTNILQYTHSVILDLWHNNDPGIDQLVTYHLPNVRGAVSVGALVVAVNKVTDILYYLINPANNEKKDHSPINVVSNRIEKYHSPMNVVSNFSEKYHTPMNVVSNRIEKYHSPVKVVSNFSEKYHTPVKDVSKFSEKYHTPVNIVSNSDSIERYYTPIKDYISKPKRSIKIPNNKKKISKEKKEYKKRVTKKKIIKEEKPKLAMIETEKNIYNIYINEK